ELFVVIPIRLNGTAERGAPLPASVARSTSVARFDFPLGCNPFVDELLVLPAVLDNDSRECEVESGIGAWFDWKPQAAICDTMRHTHGLVGRHKDELRAVQHPVCEQRGLRLVGIDTRKKRDIAVRPIFVGGGK